VTGRENGTYIGVGYNIIVDNSIWHLLAYIRALADVSFRLR